MNKKIVAAFLSMIIAAGCLTGCSGDKKTKVTVNKNGVVTSEPEKVLDPGEEFKSKLGEEFNYEKGNLNICFKEIGQTSRVDGSGERCYALIFNITNNSDKNLRVWMLDGFKVSIDGKELSFNETFSAISAANAAIKYSDYKKYDGDVAAGESLEGCVPFQVKGDWSKMQITYLPDTHNSNDYIVYEVSSDDVVNKYE